MAQISDYGAASLREQLQDKAEAYRALIARMEAGDMLPNAPWGEPQFQAMVNKALAYSGKNARAALEFSTFKAHLRDVVGPK